MFSQEGWQEATQASWVLSPVSLRRLLVHGLARIILPWSVTASCYVTLDIWQHTRWALYACKWGQPPALHAYEIGVSPLSLIHKSKIKVCISLAYIVPQWDEWERRQSSLSPLHRPENRELKRATPPEDRKWYSVLKFLPHAFHPQSCAIISVTGGNLDSKAHPSLREALIKFVFTLGIHF
jgi:hypothetical protein